MLTILFCLTGLMASEAQATPTRHTWVRATPLGVSETSYFYLLMERRNPGSYYDYTETLILVRRDISNGRLQERIQLRETRFSADADDVYRADNPVRRFNAHTKVGQDCPSYCSLYPNSGSAA